MKNGIKQARVFIFHFTLRNLWRIFPRKILLESEMERKIACRSFGTDSLNVIYDIKNVKRLPGGDAQRIVIIC